PQRLVQRFGLDIVLADYRGYGLSGGTPDEAGLYLDGLAMYAAALDAGFASQRVVVFGRSIGAAVALDVAVNRPVGGVVLESPFLSLPELARRHYPLVPAALVRTQFDNRAKIDRVSARMFVLHGDRDEIVPIAHGRALFDLAPEPKRFHTIRGAGHNDSYDVGGADYWEAWREFLEGL
ncbi:MAG TPA: alpha/beta hydrolase, partial [Acidobacteria bacterium]|nr:alpha/beta hydrolase [Acidobacteriota bacterium]